MANNLTASASVESIYFVSILSFIAPSFNKFANSIALSDFSPTIILDGYKLSYKALPSLKNSGENIIFVIPYFFFIDSTYPTGIVDFITIVVSRLIEITFSIMSSTELVSKYFVSSL